jgi:hypothetical protein
MTFTMLKRLQIASFVNLRGRKINDFHRRACARAKTNAAVAEARSAPKSDICIFVKNATLHLLLWNLQL